ncbi:MAG TPA: hypothetical protein VLZ81_09590, partial [Blastocatellia bacterium]|nr:hypothetical protein [Blastocatellia bacterium]
AQPLVVTNLKVAPASIYGATAKTKCANGCDAVIFATMKGTVYAYMADQKPSSMNDTLLWARYLSDNTACKCGATGPQNGSGDFDMWAVDDPWWGVLGTPVIDRASNSLYAVAWTNDQQYRLYNLNITTGAIQAGPVTIQGSIGSQSFVGNYNGWVQQRKQRAGLLLANGLLYVGFGGDVPPNANLMAGWLFVYDAKTLALKTIWSPTPKGHNAGIWMAGEAPAADAAGNVYLQTGDGDFAPSNQSYGDSIVKLQFQGASLSVAGYFAPCDQMFLERCDYDHGSSSPVLFDNFVVGGGKNGKLYLMNTSNLPGYQPGPYPPTSLACIPGFPGLPDCTDASGLIQKWQAAKGHIHGSPVVWSGPNNQTWLYVMGEGDHLKSFPLMNGSFNAQAVKQSAYVQPAMNQVPSCQSPPGNHGLWMPGGYLTLSSKGTTAGSGILWALVPANGDGNSCRGVKAMLMAFNAEDVTKELWRSQNRDAAVSDTPNSVGLLARFNPPVVANGKVFVPTAGDAEQLQRYGGQRPYTPNINYYLAVYGLK